MTTETPLIQILQAQHVNLENVHATAQVITGEVNAKTWSLAAATAHQLNYRLAAVWAQQLLDSFKITVCLALPPHYLLISTFVTDKKPQLDSWANIYPAANRLERHIHDLYGIVFLGSPDCRRWTRHQAWNENEFPLRRDYAASTQITSTLPDSDYPCNTIDGHSVCEIPVGPIHAGIIEPGHFRFHVAGEEVLKLEERLGYVHKGIEKIAEGREINGLLRLAGRVSGDSTVAHTWAVCRACEDALQLEIPERALFLRAIMAERERAANHLGDIGALCNDVGFAFAYYQFGRLRELWQRLNFKIFGHRFLMDKIILGGVATDIDDSAIESMLKQICEFKIELKELYTIIENNYSLQDRFITTGVLPAETAALLGTLGYVGRASSQNFDVRRDISYAPYDKFNLIVPCYTAGDVAARLKIRADEIIIALDLIVEFLRALPADDITLKKLPSLANLEGFGYVEGWRGEILVYVKFNQDGLVERYFPRDPSWFNWPALEHLIHNNIVPDFPVCNKSVNGSYAGHDL